MIERVVHPYQLQKALEHVIANKGSAGVDGISVREIRKIFTDKKLQMIEEIRQGHYQAQPILGITIPKGNGKPDYWEFLQPPKEYCNKAWHKI